MVLREEMEMQGMSRRFNMALDLAGSSDRSPALSSERQSYERER